MDSDDRLVGKVLSRREMLKLLGTVSAAGAVVLVGCGPDETPTQAATNVPAPSGATTAPTQAAANPTEAAASTEASASLPTCVVRPEMTEGPYFVDEKLNRSDIRSDPSDGSVSEGVPFQLVFRVSKIAANTCSPLAGAVVDVWHCNALGVYSDVQDPSFNTQGKKFLRGYQETDANGAATFLTIYPGWYQGRTVHIHFKIRTDPNSSAGQEFTSQLFFEDSFSDQVFTQPPYASKGQRGTLNANDGIFGNGGDQLTLQPTPSGAGYTATFDIGLQLA
jgi:protocatechuate 3,4-dioxygenase beta subunit